METKKSRTWVESGTAGLHENILWLVLLLYQHRYKCTDYYTFLSTLVIFFVLIPPKDVTAIHLLPVGQLNIHGPTWNWQAEILKCFLALWFCVTSQTLNWTKNLPIKDIWYYARKLDSFSLFPWNKQKKKKKKKKKKSFKKKKVWPDLAVIVIGNEIFVIKKVFVWCKQGEETLLIIYIINI